MGYIKIRDGYGEAIEVNTGLYLDFAAADFADEKKRIMREYRLLLCGSFYDLLERTEGKRGEFVCDDVAEFDAIREVLDTCARLAAFACGYGAGKRKPELKDLDEIRGLSLSDGSGFLHIDLKGSYWYKRFLYSVLFDFDYVPGDNVGAPITDRTWKHERYANEFFPRADNPTTLLHAARELYGAAADFWSEDVLTIAALGDAPEDIAYNMSYLLLLMHTRSTWHLFSFDDGFKLFAPLGLTALWADFAQSVAKRPIRICKECGKPVVENHPPRGKPRQYCSNACRKRASRRSRKEEQDKSAETEQ